MEENSLIRLSESLDLKCPPKKSDIKLNVHSSTLYSIELGIVPGSFLLILALFFYCCTTRLSEVSLTY